MQHQPTASAILNGISEGVFTVDLAWRITSINRAAAEITGVNPGDVIGTPCWEVFHSDRCREGCALRRAMETGQPAVQPVVHIRRPGGGRTAVSVSAAALKGPDGRVVGAVQTFRDLAAVQILKERLRDASVFENMVSRSDRMHELFEVLPLIASSDATVLVEGPSGTGKELVARAVHNLSSRAGAPMVTINCGALPDTLLESELFGHVAGAFTDARRDKPGRFALAEGGTVFLDEIGDISPAMQSRLLRVLQERVYEPLGSSRPVRTDVRVIAASNKDLDEEVQNGRFREDLFFRLNVIKVALPPLRDRIEDVPLLVDHFIQRFNSLRGRAVQGVSAKALAVLMAHDWPGNIRELENAIEHATILCLTGLIRSEHLPDHLRRNPGPAPSSLQGALGDVEAELIRETLKKFRWNRTAAADALGIHKTTLWRKMKRLGIRMPRARRDH